MYNVLVVAQSSFCFFVKRELQNLKPRWCKEHEDWTMYLFAPENRFRLWCQAVISHKLFDHIVLVFIFLNCITIALERPDINKESQERLFLSVSNYIFTVIFLAEMTIKVVAQGFCFGPQTYLQSSWNVLDGLLVFVSLVDILVTLANPGGNRILGILRVLRLLRTLRPLRVISRAPGLKLVVETLITSLRPIGNIVLICCAFFIIFGILGVQLFKGKFYHCEGMHVKNITNKSDCLDAKYRWIRRKYNFDNLVQALMSLFVLSCKDGWVNIMYDGLDAVGVDQQPVRNHNPWMLLYFISFLLIVSFFVLNMFVGVVVENFHKCRQDQEEERRAYGRRRGKRCWRKGAGYLEEVLKYCNYVFTAIFVVEALLKLVAFGIQRFFKDRWNQLDIAIVALSIMGITLEELKMNAALPINPTIIRIMRVLRIARVLKLLKMAKGMRSLLDTVMQALPQVGNLGLLFMLLFFIYAALGVELFGKLECTEDNPCEGLSRHATFENFGMAFLTLFRFSIYFVTFVLMAQFVLVNVVVAVLMKHLEESNKEAKEDAEIDAEIELEMALENQRRASTGSNNSSMGGTYIGPCPNSPEEEDEVHYKDQDPSSTKMSVSRMHSLPNDSYMFRPVRPASAPYPLEEVELSPQHAGDKNTMCSDHVMSVLLWPLVTSVHSQPCERRSLLQVPDMSPHSPATSSPQALPRIAPPTPPLPPEPCADRLLSKWIQWRCIALSTRRDPTLSVCLLCPLSRVFLPPASSSSFLTLCSASSFTLLSLSASVLSLSCPVSAVLSFLPPSSSLLPRSAPSSSAIPRLPLRPPSLRRPRPMLDTRDPADEEVCHITSAACRQWGAEEGQGDTGRTCRSHSLSPYAPPFCHDFDPIPAAPVTAPAQAARSTLSLLTDTSQERDLKKGFSTDNQCFLGKTLSAGFPDDQRRHSIEVCLPQLIFTSDEAPEARQWPEKVPVRVQSVGGGHRKKKLSPPCISIQPPSEKEPPLTDSPPKLSDCSMLLRRRTPSYDLSPHTQSQEACTDTQSSLSPIHRPLQVHSPSHTLALSAGSTPTHGPSFTSATHIPISPNIFIQPRAPLAPMPCGQSPSPRHSPHPGNYSSLPQFTFDQPQTRYMSGLQPGLSDSDSPTCSSPFDNRLRSSPGFSAKNRRTAQ
ncbi:hypothetical protein WMY93_002997 [Mugilogobius chulae]|uniref:Ion transport domain-containing protein n=1 Tax=Mugilogobius chulae TaxID=88201 RepID=A0AAW0PV88_9GOBI